MNSDNMIYQRGTRTARVRTARLAPGNRVLTFNGTDQGHTYPTVAKTDSVIRVVDRLEFKITQGHGYHGRAQRTYDVVFTDNTRAVGLAPILTWHALVCDTESSASRQHFIDTGWYLTPAEVAEAARQQQVGV